MADVQLGQVWDFVDELDVGVVNSVAGIDLQIEIERADRGFTQALELLLLEFVGEGVGQLAGVQLDR